MADGQYRAWRYRKIATAAIAIVVSGSLPGCVAAGTLSPTGSSPDRSEVADSPAPSPTVIAGGDRPPTTVQDCSELISIDELSAVLGVHIQSLEMRQPDEASANVGAVVCGWSTVENPDVSDAGQLWVMPRAGMDPHEFAALGNISGYACLYSECTALVGGANVLVGSTVPDESGDQEGSNAALAMAARIGDAVLAASGDDPGSWVRNRESWAGIVDCDAVGAALGAAVGRDVHTWTGLGFDPPRLWVSAAERASNLSSCEFEATGDSGVSVVIQTDAGTAWTVHEWVRSNGFVEIDGGGMPGFATYTDGDGYYLASDGTNRVRMYYLDRSGSGPEGRARVAETFPPDLLNETAARILAGEFAT